MRESTIALISCTRESSFADSSCHAAATHEDPARLKQHMHLPLRLKIISVYPYIVSFSSLP